MRRNDFGLAQLFGASFDGGIEGPMQNSYLNIEKDTSTGRFHPLLHGLEDAKRLINGVYRIKMKPAASPGYSPLTLVPSYPDLPMEEVYARVKKTDIPGVYVREVGRGRVVYFPWDVDRTFWEVLDVNHARLLKNAVLWATNEEQPLEVTGAGVFDISVWMQKISMAVHLVNLTNPMMMKGPIREIIPSPPQHVKIRIPDGRKVSAVRLLVSGGKASFRNSSNMLELTIPSVGLHEVIAIDL